MLWDKILLKQFAYQVESSLSSMDADIVFSLWTNPIAYLRTDKPIVFWGDATLKGLMERYPGYDNLCAETIKDGYMAEQVALTQCRLAIYSSEWAASTAIQYYDVDPAKVKVVPFGANIECSRDIQDIQTIIHNKQFEVCKLLFIGKEWERKGGDTAVEVAGHLNRNGIPCELHMVGCQPTGEVPDFVKLYGYISKESEDGRQQFDELFRQSHFFILPTRADCTPVVFPEAGSFGLPVLTSNVGGIPTVIRDGVNGFTFPVEAAPEAYCEAIERLWSSKGAYEQLALTSFQEYSDRLNWDTAGQSISKLLHEYCG